MGERETQFKDGDCADPLSPGKAAITDSPKLPRAHHVSLTLFIGCNWFGLGVWHSFLLFSLLTLALWLHSKCPPHSSIQVGEGGSSYHSLVAKSNKNGY